VGTLWWPATNAASITSGAAVGEGRVDAAVTVNPYFLERTLVRRPSHYDAAGDAHHRPDRPSRSAS